MNMAAIRDLSALLTLNTPFLPKSRPTFSSRDCRRCSSTLHTIRSMERQVAAPQGQLARVTPELNPLPSTFKRLIARRTGDSFADVAEIVEQPIMLPKDGEVLIKVAYAGINGGCETFRARGEHAFASNRAKEWFPLGAEGAGTIVRMGSNVDDGRLTVGQPVTFIGGAFSEYVICKASTCWPVAVATPEMVALTISGTVANAALRFVGGMDKRDTVLVTAAGGATGSFAVQLAIAAGCRVIATCGSEAKAKKLSSLGLERIINYRNENIFEVLKNEYGGKIDIAYEGVGGRLQSAAWECLKRPGGRLLSIGYISEYPHVSEKSRKAEETAQREAHELAPSADLFWGGRVIESVDGRVAYGQVWPPDRSMVLQAKQEVFDAYANGRLQAWIDEKQFFGLEKATAAVEYMLSGTAIGKVILGL